MNDKGDFAADIMASHTERGLDVAWHEKQAGKLHAHLRAAGRTIESLERRLAHAEEWQDRNAVTLDAEAEMRGGLELRLELAEQTPWPVRD